MLDDAMHINRRIETWACECGDLLEIVFINDFIINEPDNKAAKAKMLRSINIVL